MLLKTIDHKAGPAAFRKQQISASAVFSPKKKKKKQQKTKKYQHNN